METERTGSAVAVVFGAAGGIGGAIVSALAAGGGYSVIHAGSRAGATGREGISRPFCFDLRDEASIAAAAEAAGPVVDLVVIASGVLRDPEAGVEPEKSVRAIDAAAMRRVFEVNTIGPALIAKHFLGRLPRERRGVFAAVSARVGSIGDNRLGGWHAYRASKAALNMLIANFAIELARTRPHAVAAALHPGTVRTRLSQPFARGRAAEQAVSPETAARRLLGVIDGLQPEDSGGLFSWTGERLAW